MIEAEPDYEVTWDGTRDAIQQRINQRPAPVLPPRPNAPPVGNKHGPQVLTTLRDRPWRWWTYEQLAAELSVSIHAVRDCLRRLRAQGLTECARLPHKGAGSAFLVVRMRQEATPEDGRQRVAPPTDWASDAEARL